MLTKCFRDEAVLVHGHVLHLGFERAEHHERCDVTRPFRKHQVARVEKQFGHELQRVLGPRRDDDVLGVRPDALERHYFDDVLPKCGNPLPRAVLQRLGSPFPNDSVHGFGNEVSRQRRDEGHATCQ